MTREMKENNEESDPNREKQSCAVFESVQYRTFESIMDANHLTFTLKGDAERIGPGNDKWPTLVQKLYLQRRDMVRTAWGKNTKWIALFFVALLILVTLLFLYWPVWSLIVDDAAKGGYRGVLGLDSSAGKKEIKSAYRQLARKWHPDHNPSCGTPCRDRMMEIQEAYDILMAEEDSTHLVDDTTREVFTFIIAIMSGNVTQLSYYCVCFVAAFGNFPWWVVVGLRLVLDGILSAYVYYMSGSWFLGGTLVLNMVRSLQSMRDPRKHLANSADKHYYLVYVLGPIAVITTVQFQLTEVYPRLTTLALRLLLGLVYTSAFIAEYKVSFWHNRWGMECRLGHRNFEIRIVLSLLMGDMFAYFLGVPGVCRMAVFSMIAGFLYQTVTLPMVVVGDGAAALAAQQSIWETEDVQKAVSSTDLATKVPPPVPSMPAARVAPSGTIIRRRNPLDSSDEEEERFVVVAKKAPTIAPPDGVGGKRAQKAWIQQYQQQQDSSLSKQLMQTLWALGGGSVLLIALTVLASVF